MNSKRVSIYVASAIIVLAFNSVALAGGKPVHSVPSTGIQSVASGFYIEVNPGWSSVVPTIEPEDLYDVDRNGFGFNVNVGYKIVPNFAIEGGYTYYGDVKVRGNNKNPLGSSDAFDVKDYGFDVAAKVMIPLKLGFGVFGKVGVSWVRSRITDPGVFSNGGNTDNLTSVYYGAGVDYAIHPNLLVNFQWNRAEGKNDIKRLRLVSVGIAYYL